MRYRIVGIDPGQTTGLTAFTASDEDGITCVDSYELDMYGVGEYLRARPYDIIAFEVANKFQASGHMSSEIIGLAKYFALTKGAECVGVTQSSHKKLISRDVLKRAGLNVKGTHAKDAAGVGLFYVISNLKWMSGVLRPEEG